jgi:hypothetical protein
MCSWSIYMYLYNVPLIINPNALDYVYVKVYIILLFYCHTLGYHTMPYGAIRVQIGVGGVRNGRYPIHTPTAKN